MCVSGVCMSQCMSECVCVCVFAGGTFGSICSLHFGVEK